VIVQKEVFLTSMTVYEYHTVWIPQSAKVLGIPDRVDERVEVHWVVETKGRNDPARPRKLFTVPVGVEFPDLPVNATHVGFTGYVHVFDLGEVP